MNERMSAADFNRLSQGSKPAGSKYRAQPVTVDGIRFDSKHEAKRWAQLKLLEKGGAIRDLERQVPLMLEGRNGPLLTRTGRGMRLTVDFRYFDVALGLTVWEDAKGMPTPDYEVRRAVAAAQGVPVVEV
ncbi:DUF1064 domain-containing protein [Salipiger sp. IMCC34102]|uniref:DUF1064 domain-containing protein n=1 Tax=Salipiger sp. IMCC34102 TaxID=2510647 RepID=UPI00101BE8E6|nr:DUF1064 domain-containing protein [Salipiger sp. IMCC34102]RYH04112.1 DUF1064 domain-containing protein [Salipiger sp. IMCC34102]